MLATPAGRLEASIERTFAECEALHLELFALVRGLPDSGSERARRDAGEPTADLHEVRVGASRALRRYARAIGDLGPHEARSFHEAELQRFKFEVSHWWARNEHGHLQNEIHRYIQEYHNEALTAQAEARSVVVRPSRGANEVPMESGPQPVVGEALRRPSKEAAAPATPPGDTEKVLKKTEQQLKAQCERMKGSMMELRNSSSQLKETRKRTNLLASNLKAAGGFLRNMRERAKSDSAYVWMAIGFYVCVVAFIFLKRLKVLRMAWAALKAATWTGLTSYKVLGKLTTWGRGASREVVPATPASMVPVAEVSDLATGTPSDHSTEL